jgi:ATP-dependent Clp protease ATP-binding subunit ClpA
MSFRFDEDMLTVMKIAKERSQAGRHSFIENEHILSGILGLNDSIAKNILTKFGYATTSSEIIGSDPVKKEREDLAIMRHEGELTLRDSALEALVWNADVISPIHVLLSILRRRQKNDLAFRDLTSANISYRKVELELLSGMHSTSKIRFRLSKLFHHPYLRTSRIKRWIAPLA